MFAWHRSKSPIYNSVLRIMWVIAFLLLLILVILTIQYPYYHQSDSIISFLGVQVVFVLPLLAQLMNGGVTVSALEQQIMASDIVEYIGNYVLLQQKQSQTNPGDDGGQGGASQEQNANRHDDADVDADSAAESIANAGGNAGDANAGNAFADTGSTVLNRLYDNPFAKLHKV